MPLPPTTDSGLHAIVISHFGNEVLIQTPAGERLRAIPRQNLPALATGDRVSYAADNTGLASIHAVAPRHGILSRLSKNQEKPVAVNIDKVLIVSAAKPALKTGLIDRYLVACELAGLAAIVVFNKIDLLDAKQYSEVQTCLEVYTHIGYPVLFLSAKTGAGIDQLQQLLEGCTSVLVGHSAVGKSSLIKSLVPRASPRIGEISAASKKGRHTTTHSELYPLANGGMIIDSPGVREFALKAVSAEQLAQGFREFQPYLGQCKFRDCTHTGEPACAIMQATEQGLISRERVESYRNILLSFKDG